MKVVIIVHLCDIIQRYYQLSTSASCINKVEAFYKHHKQWKPINCEAFKECTIITYEIIYMTLV